MSDAQNEDHLLQILDALCADVGVSRRRLSLMAGLSDSAVKHVAHGSSRSPRVETLARLSKAASRNFTMFLGKHCLRAHVSASHIDGGLEKPAIVSLKRFAADFTHDEQEIRWLETWRDMSQAQRRRATALLKAMSEADEN